MTITFVDRIQRLLLLPLVSSAPLVRKIFKGKSDKELRDDEKAHQAAVRRELRGLPALHDQSSFHP